MAEGARLHAGCVAVGESGVLIAGPAGSGKSSLARDLLDAARREGFFARLVSDDRTLLQARHGRLIARPVAPLAGLMEARGLGLLARPFEAAAVVRLVVELSADEPPRWPEDGHGPMVLCGIEIPRFFCRRGAPSTGLVLGHLRGSTTLP
jgi:hypothetical protein